MADSAGMYTIAAVRQQTPVKDEAGNVFTPPPEIVLEVEHIIARDVGHAQQIAATKIGADDVNDRFVTIYAAQTFRA